MPITRLEQILDALRSRPRKRLVAAWAVDPHTIEAVHEAVRIGIVDGALVGDETRIRATCREHGVDAAAFQIVHEPDDVSATRRAVAMVNAGEARILMKGMVTSDRYMKAILDKQDGLLDPGAILSHVSVIENPRYPRLIVCGDVAVIPAPDLRQKVAITRYVIAVARALGIERPKVALIAATEQVLPSMTACTDAAAIALMGARGEFGDAQVAGPLGLDVAIDPESAALKGVTAPVAGDADGLVFPAIEAGNVFYKVNTKLAGAELGAMVAGARAPCVLTSRGDSARTKTYSIALAALTAG
jgi:phosphate butyryltransferase